ncbi:MAG: hypothetical protein FJ102_03525 [Deltaproteobacteria bacterium]|nr:hypothetical protein [Deltaproteobacteria bacterium]
MSLQRVSWARVEPARGDYASEELALLGGQVRADRAAGLEPVLVIHGGALPDWQLARGGWLDPGALAAWSCLVDRVAQAVGVHVGHYLVNDDLLREAWWYDGDAPRVARALVEAHATAYLHLRRSSGPGGRPPLVGTWVRRGPGRGHRLELRLLEVLGSGRWKSPFGRMGELPNGTACLDLVATDDPGLLPSLVPLARPVLLVGIDAAEGRRAGVIVGGLLGRQEPSLNP